MRWFEAQQVRSWWLLTCAALTRWFPRGRRFAYAASLVGLAVVAIFAFVAMRVTWLYPRAAPSDQLTAMAVLLGGFIGAGGTAVAVYLTLAAQRRDEAQKVEAALRIEVAELGRRAHAALEVCESVMSSQAEVPVRDLPVLIAMPEAIVFKATADRVSRLTYGQLLVVLYARVTEVLQMVAIYATAKPLPFIPDDRIAGMVAAGEAHRMLTKEQAKTLATGWFDICEIVRSILIRDPNSFALAESVVAEILSDLEADRVRVAPLIKEPPT